MLMGEETTAKELANLLVLPPLIIYAPYFKNPDLLNGFDVAGYYKGIFAQLTLGAVNYDHFRTFLAGHQVLFGDDYSALEMGLQEDGCIDDVLAEIHELFQLELAVRRPSKGIYKIRPDKAVWLRG